MNTVIIVRFILVILFLLVLNYGFNKMYETGYQRGYTDRAADVRSAWIQHANDETTEFNQVLVNTLHDTYRGYRYKKHRQRHN